MLRCDGGRFIKRFDWKKIMHKRLRPISARRINAAEPYEVTYWSKILGVSEDDLMLAVSEVGEDIERVRQVLAKQQKGPDSRRQSA
jgi:hypothetical protein